MADRGFTTSQLPVACPSSRRFSTLWPGGGGVCPSLAAKGRRGRVIAACKLPVTREGISGDFLFGEFMGFLPAFAVAYLITAVHYIARDKRRHILNQPLYIRKGLRGYVVTAIVWLPFMIPILWQDWKYIRRKVVWKYKLEAFTSLSILICSTVLLMNWHH